MPNSKNIFANLEDLRKRMVEAYCQGNPEEALRLSRELDKLLIVVQIQNKKRLRSG